MPSWLDAWGDAIASWGQRSEPEDSATAPAAQPPPGRISGSTPRPAPTPETEASEAPPPAPPLPHSGRPAEEVKALGLQRATKAFHLEQAAGSEQRQPEVECLGKDGPFAAGEIVSYLSKTQGSWMQAKVLAANPDGTYDLDCKPGAPADRIKRRDEASQPSSPGSSADQTGGARYKVGDAVEYLSTSHKAWISASVVAVNADGTYSLDCKPGVPAEKIRTPEPSVRSPMGRGHRREAPVGQPTPLARSHAAGASSSTSPASRQSSFAVLHGPAKLVSARRVDGRWVYSVCQEGMELLTQVGRRPIAIASLLALHGSGKGLLLNLLLERVQQGLPPLCRDEASQDESSGLWLWGFFRSEEHGPSVALLDCEVAGEADSMQDSHLLAACLLVSSVLMLRTKGARGLGGSLSLCHRAAQQLAEPCGSMGRPALLWLLCDVLQEGAGGLRSAPQEHLEQVLQKPLRAVSIDGLVPGHEGAPLDVHHELQRCFGLRGCATLPQPVVGEERRSGAAGLDIDALSSDFLAGVRSLRAQLLGLCRASPRGSSSGPLTGPCLAAALAHSVEALNSQAKLSFRQSQQAADVDVCARLVQDLHGRAVRTLRGLAAGETLLGGARLPMSDEALNTILRDQRHTLKNQFDERAVGDEGLRKEYWLELKQCIASEEAIVRQRNTQLAERELSEVLATWQAWLEDASAPLSEGQQISKDVGQLLERMPSTHANRVGRAALEVAARQVANARAEDVPSKARLLAAQLFPTKLLPMPQRRSVSWQDEKMLEQIDGEVSTPSTASSPGKSCIRSPSWTSPLGTGDDSLGLRPCQSRLRRGQQQQQPKAPIAKEPDAVATTARIPCEVQGTTACQSVEPTGAPDRPPPPWSFVCP